jgi:hypothetical protein
MILGRTMSYVMHAVGSSWPPATMAMFFLVFLFVLLGFVAFAKATKGKQSSDEELHANVEQSGD